MRIIGQCHAMLHANGVVRIQSDIRVGSRIDKKQSFSDKGKPSTSMHSRESCDEHTNVTDTGWRIVKAVEKLLAADDDTKEDAQ